jgi:hypothetical protein
MGRFDIVVNHNMTADLEQFTRSTHLLMMYSLHTPGDADTFASGPNHTLVVAQPQ